MAQTKKAPAPDKFRVSVRLQLYVEGPQTGLVIAGNRLLKGDLDTMQVPQISFVSDSPEEAEANRKTLENYLNAWEKLHGRKPLKK